MSLQYSLQLKKRFIIHIWSVLENLNNFLLFDLVRHQVIKVTLYLTMWKIGNSQWLPLDWLAKYFSYYYAVAVLKVHHDEMNQLASTEISEWQYVATLFQECWYITSKPKLRVALELTGTVCYQWSHIQKDQLQNSHKPECNPFKISCFPLPVSIVICVLRVAHVLIVSPHSAMHYEWFFLNIYFGKYYHSNSPLSNLLPSPSLSYIELLISLAVKC